MIKISTFEVTYFISSEKNEKILSVKKVQNEIDNNVQWECEREEERKGEKEREKTISLGQQKKKKKWKEQNEGLSKTKRIAMLYI